MLLDFLRAAMGKAACGILADDGGCYGEIPGFRRAGAEFATRPGRERSLDHSTMLCPSLRRRLVMAVGARRNGCLRRASTTAGWVRLLHVVACFAVAPSSGLGASEPVRIADVESAVEQPIVARFADLVGAGHRLFFTAWDHEHGLELWSSDGTPGTGRLVRDVFPDTGSSRPVRLVRAGDRVFFVATDAEHGAELWVSDGTPQGTALVGDMFPGVAGSNPDLLTPLGRQIFCRVSTDEGGDALWMSDGSESGTRRVADIVPGSGGSAPGPFGVAGDHLVFAAQESTAGREPWALSLEALVPGFVRGDATADGRVNLLDPTVTFVWLCRGGEPPTCRDAVDSNDDGRLDLADPIRTLLFLFRGGPKPPGPFPSCGVDPTGDLLGCVRAPPCG